MSNRWIMSWELAKGVVTLRRADDPPPQEKPAQKKAPRIARTKRIKRPGPPRPRLTGEELQSAKASARERYAAIAAALKAEAGVRRHFHHKTIGGLAFTGLGKILAPEGVTRRQLYVLAHECGHVVLHRSREDHAKPGHVKEHEAETYAHRAFARYGLEVPEKSAKWARAYVGQWIMKDQQAGVPICPMALQFARGERSPLDPMPSIEGQPPRDFSAQLEKFTTKGVQLVQTIEAQTPPAELTSEEKAMMAQLKKRAARLDRKGVAGAFGTFANAAEQVERVKAQHMSAIPAIARGLEALQRLEQDHRTKRRERVRIILKDRGELKGWLTALAFFAAAALMIGMSGTAEAFYFAGFFAITAAIMFAFLILALLTE